MNTSSNSFSKKEAIRFGWEATKKNFWLLTGILLLPFVFQFAVSFLTQYIKDQTELLMLISFISYVVSLGLSLGAIKIYLNIIDNRNAKFSDLFSLFNWRLMLRYLLASIIYGVLILIGYLFFVIPGIYLSIKYGYYPYILVDKNVGVFESFSESGKITKGNILDLFVFELLLFLIALAGILVFLVGLFVALPIISLAGAFVYRKLSSRILVTSQNPVI